MGGGRANLMPCYELDPEHGYTHAHKNNREHLYACKDNRGHRQPCKGKREDSRNIINEWLARKQSRGQRAEYVWNKHNFDDVDVEKTDALIGL